MFSHLAAGNVLESIVPISRFNRGGASKIFEEVAAAGYKIVVKNNKPTCVLLSPERYADLMDKLEDYALFMEAERRVSDAGNGGTISHEALMSEFGISEAALNDVEVEIV